MILTEEEIIKIEQTPSRSYIVHARAIEQAILDKLQDKLKNAERYEWLGMHLDDTEALEELYKYAGDIPTPEELDKAIDSAIAKDRN